MNKYKRKSSFNKGIFFQDSFLFIINQKASPKTHKEGVVIELVSHVPYWACLKTFKLGHGEKVYPSLLLSSNHKFWTKEEGKRRRWQPCFGKMFCLRPLLLAALAIFSVTCPRWHTTSSSKLYGFQQPWEMEAGFPSSRIFHKAWKHGLIVSISVS